MIYFVNAKINLGLNIIERRPDGYHNLESIFLPVGKSSGTPSSPDPFSDILEVVPSDKREFIFTGKEVDCPLEKHLVFKAYHRFCENLGEEVGAKIYLDKHLPFGAGMGGGSADAAFTLKALNDLVGTPFNKQKLKEIAATLGADCPFFIDNIPAYVEGIGEKIHPIDDLQNRLQNRWLLVIKPDLMISTAEAFSQIKPHKPEHDLRESVKAPIEEWKNLIFNDFEASLFGRYPELPRLKDCLYKTGAEFALMTGSGSALFGIYPDEHVARLAALEIEVPYKACMPL